MRSRMHDEGHEGPGRAETERQPAEEFSLSSFSLVVPFRSSFTLVASF